MYRTITPSSVFLDDSGPRPLPSYLRQPLPPPPEETVRPCVPDVSLIFGLPLDRQQKGTTLPVLHTNNQDVAHQPWRSDPPGHEKQPSTTTSNPPFSSNIGMENLIRELIGLVKQQSIKIEGIEDQLQSLVQLQKQKVEVGTRKEVGIQTEVVVSSKPDPKRPILPASAPYELPRRVDIEELRKDVSPHNTQDFSKILKELDLPITAEQSIYSVHNSSPHVDMPEFTEHNNGPLNKSEVENSPGIGPSISEYGSSDDDEPEIQPTVTYYRNVLGNVNRLLENHSNSPRLPKLRTRNGNSTNGGLRSQEEINRANNNLLIQQNVYNSIFIPNSNGNCTGEGGNERQAPEPLPRNFLPVEDSQKYRWNGAVNNNTDTTVYGMSSANLSFATRDYLERHGLNSGNSRQQHQHHATNGRATNRALEPAWHNHAKFC